MTRLKPLWGDERGGVLLETTIMLTILLIFILGSVDFLMAMYQWNAAGKAVQIGARIAAVSDPVANGLIGITGLEGGASPGDFPPPAFTTRTCTATSGTFGAAGSCTGGGTYNADAMQRIVYGRTGGTSCTDATSPYEIGMCDAFPRVAPENVSVSYIYSGLGFAGRPLNKFGTSVVPTVTVSLQNIPFRFFFLGGLMGFANIPIPPLTTTITGEDLSKLAP
jgi:hypothetical protein